jgi:hypothetical protein
VLGPAPGDDGASGTSPHPNAEAVRLRTFTVVRLECALHENDSLKPVMMEGRQRFGAETAPKLRWYGPPKPGVNAAISPLATVRRTRPEYPFLREGFEPIEQAKRAAVRLPAEGGGSHGSSRVWRLAAPAR